MVKWLKKHKADVMLVLSLISGIVTSLTVGIQEHKSSIALALSIVTTIVNVIMSVL